LHSITVEAVAMNVYGGTITSSPGLTPQAIRANRSEIEPFTQLIAYLLPQNAANSFSNFPTKSPQSGLPHFPLAMTFETAVTSPSSKIGHEKIFVICFGPPLIARCSFMLYQRSYTTLISYFFQAISDY